MPEIPPRLRTIELCRVYRRGGSEVRAVDHVDLAIARGTFVALTGASGSGKSTLLNLLAGLDTPTSGRVEVDGFDLGSLSRRQLARYRADRVGMVFQTFNLLPHQTALQNVELALMLKGVPRRERRPRATAILERVGLAERLDHRPADLSGGEQQRVAMARALVKRPDILFADEPTGNLDEQNARQMIELLLELHREGMAVVLATHDLETAERHAERVVRLHYGRIVQDRPATTVTETPR
jgi:putative ABC transport system ATP-binding protein